LILAAGIDRALALGAALRVLFFAVLGRLVTFVFAFLGEQNTTYGCSSPKEGWDFLPRAWHNYNAVEMEEIDEWQSSVHVS
jgi:hypothetical protein